MSTPLMPPATPYCILTDRYLQKYFTRDRIRQHLRRAGLINKSGHILTEAEYENRLMNIEIGRTNQLKFEEALLEVIIELGEKQYRSLCEEMENVKKQLQCQFGRIERKYMRRIHPIKIRVKHSGHIEKNSTLNNFKDDQIPITTQIEPWAQPWNQPEIPERNRLDEILKKFDELIDRMKTLAKINESNTFLLNLPETLRQLKENQEQIRKQQYLWKKEYDKREIQGTHEMKGESELLWQQINASTRDKRHSEQEIPTSAARKSLCDNSSHLHRSYDAIPVEGKQIALGAAIKANGKETTKRENPHEKLVGDARENFEKWEHRVNDGSPKTISRAEVEKLIRDAIANLKPTEKDDKRVIDPSKRQRSQSMKKSNQTTAAPQSSNTEKATSKNQKNNSLTPNVESGLHDNSVPSTVEGFKDYTDTIQHLRNQIDNLNQIKPDRQAVDDSFKLVEQIKEQEITDLRKKINKYDDDLSKFSADLASLRRQVTQKPISTPAPLTSDSLPMKKYTDEELQAIMPFMEPLPTFVMHMAYEGNPFY
ncbi:unnamed protein product [Rotaria socialis]|uniref:Uncharacterized protein n=1 Tax=Rotaria socialis TaxID=392032 RepID=A0A818PAT8_9BILA|nr:unnamed protein product [Rotaria socialis]CAF4871528.1 unnamed protein product [Rotaria socialis]